MAEVISVKPSKSAYLVFTVPIAIVFAIFAFAYAKHGHPLWPMASAFTLLMVLVALIIWSNTIELRDHSLSFRGIWGKKTFPVSLIRIKILFRSMSDQDARGLTKLVGFYLELYLQGHESVKSNRERVDA